MSDPQLADPPDTPQDIAWEIRHCADRLDSLSELASEMPARSLFARSLMLSAFRSAAIYARTAARYVEGERP